MRSKWLKPAGCSNYHLIENGSTSCGKSFAIDGREKESTIDDPLACEICRQNNPKK
jgi:hypothetical protein